MMRTWLAFALFPALLSPAIYGQAPSARPTASSLLSPALEDLKGSLSAVRVDRWKSSGSRREEASSNIGSIQRDLDGTLPGLLATADAAPGSVAGNLPVFRNVDALYDVLLRVVQTADLFAPKADADTLHSALNSLENARRSLGDALQSAAAAQEQQTASLRAQLQAQAQQTPAKPASPAVVDDGATPAPVHKHRATKKPAKPPVTPPQ